MKRVVLIVLDSVGCGALPDADKFGDEGSNTIGHIAEALGGLQLPNLTQLGIGNILDIQGVATNAHSLGFWGKAASVSTGKDTTSGHWEISGLLPQYPFPTYPHGFPEELIQNLCDAIGQKKVLGNCVASGTEIIQRLGDEHVQTGFPIVYTSADSVLQIAAHEEVIPLPQLYLMCRIARDICVGQHGVGRVIARPFLGNSGHYERTVNRRDYSLVPPSGGMLAQIQKQGLSTVGIGKISDIFAGENLTQSYPVHGNEAQIDTTVSLLQEVDNGLIFANLVDFDMLYGHRNDVVGYGQALEYFDSRLPEIMVNLKHDDLLIITADHGNDPTTASTDHNREYIPIMIYSPDLHQGQSLGIRHTFADIGATVVDYLGAAKIPLGTSMLEQLI